MTIGKQFLMIGFAGLALLAARPLVANAMDLDWSGQFRAEAHWVHNYALDSTDAGAVPDATRAGQGGYYIPGGGSQSAHFQTLFLKLRPKLIVNDNIYIKSEWWLGDPVFGFFGNAAPYTTDQRQYYSNQSRGSTITAQRFWGEFLSDIGTVQVGRAPLNWGLGLVWNAGDNIWDRYESTGDVIRLVSKFGAFSFTPSIVKYSMGNTIGGACNIASGTCSTQTGGGGVSDYSLMFKYENPDEDFEGGVNFVKRIAGAAQDPASGFLGVGKISDAAQVPAGMNYNIWDLYGHKKLGRFTFGGEVPITAGDIGGLPYKTFALALEGNWKMSEAWELGVRTGHAPGQPNIAGATADQYKAFYFNPNYKLGLIMFNYQLNNFGGLQTQNNPSVGAQNLASPYDNPIANANYLSINPTLHLGDKWNLHTVFTYAKANETASAGSAFFNTWSHKYFTNNGGDQSNSLGWEADLGTTFQWDEGFQFNLDAGWFLPGDFFKFSNVAGVENRTDSVFATVVRVGVTF